MISFLTGLWCLRFIFSSQAIRCFIQSLHLLLVKLMNIEFNDDDVIIVPSNKEDEYFRNLSREYTIPCAFCRDESCNGNCDKLYAWKRKLLGLDKKKGRTHRG